ncbi:hypothetical protein OGAPHI_000237 [Ogataea philodendri]|uniref:Alpha-1,2-mannosyltransferase n=1 Tax=Ogataea philodendri TaxID=1378263 RepID=A0A9P8PHV8_9ASCO|nr:uncharacterized protein OGAPHI_000237 [Ogataea philodendri]KAH3671534.1 hypothetical protein OGAPHI_000237 [Ogataea philodendri]
MFFARNKRAKTLILTVVVICIVLFFSTSTGSQHLSKLKLPNSASYSIYGTSKTTDGTAESPLPSSSLEDAENLKKLYFNPSQEGTIDGGSTGNTKGSKISSIDESKGQRTDDRSFPLTGNQSPTEDSLNKITPEDIIRGDITFQNYFIEIFETMKKNSLSYPLAERQVLKDGKPFIENVLFYAQTWDRLSEHDCSGFLNFPAQFVNDLTLKHETVVSSLPNTAPKFYKGSGYVIVGGGKYSWFALLGIETLRKVGSTLPVEVILPFDSDYEFEYCDQILPALNARCVEMTRVFGKETLKKFEVNGYQFKPFALFASSFENAFFLDSDAYPVGNPDVLFQSDLYKEYQMITWPDFWRRTTSPYFYQITGQEVGPKQVRHINDVFTDPKYYQSEDNADPYNNIPFHDREGTIPDWTTEAGEMLINKTLHFKTLLLALYYNFDGPYGYYPLLSQGGAGEGDKETFVAAAHYYGLKYYQVYKMPDRAYGWFNHEQNYEHSSIVQYDPLTDFKNLQDVKENIRRAIEEEGESFHYEYDRFFHNYFLPSNSKVLFYHVHDPKMDPFNIVDNRFTFDLDGNRIRNLGEDFPNFDFDLENFIWNVINHYVCEKRINFKHFENANWNSLCDGFIQDQLSFLSESSARIFRDHNKTPPAEAEKTVEEPAKVEPAEKVETPEDVAVE